MCSRTVRLLCAFALCACALGALSQVSRQDDFEAERISLPEPRRARIAQAASAPSTSGVANSSHSVDIADSVDPFAPRGWQAEPGPTTAPTALVVTPVIVAANDVAPLPTAPAMPFTFMGRMSDGAVAMVYISRGEESWTIKGGETLDGNYKVLSIAPQQIVFEHIPTGTQQTLAIPDSDK